MTSSFGRIRALPSSADALPRFITEILALAAQSSTMPLEMAAAGGISEPLAEWRDRRVDARTDLPALHHLGRRRLARNSGVAPTLTESGDRDGIAWQDLYWAIDPSHGALWADFKQFLAETGLAIPYLSNATDAESLSVAQRVLHDAATVISDAIDSASPTIPWLSRLAATRRQARIRSIQIEVARYACDTSQPYVLRNHRLSWVYVGLGWFDLGGTLRLGVHLITDPWKRALREVLLHNAQSAGIGDHWTANEYGWHPLTSFAEEHEEAEPASWMCARMLELHQAGMLEPLDRSGKHPDHVPLLAAQAKAASPAPDPAGLEIPGAEEGHGSA